MQSFSLLVWAAAFENSQRTYFFADLYETNFGALNNDALPAANSTT